MSIVEHMQFFETGLYPAIQHLLGEAVLDWPATHCVAADPRGRETRVVPRDAVPQLMNHIRFELQNETGRRRWGRGTFAMHLLQDTGAETFDWANEDGAASSLTNFFDEARILPNAPELGLWYVDVGLRISSKLGRCVQWKTETHPLVFQRALGISRATTKRIIGIGSRRYRTHLVSQLTAVGGFSLVPSTGYSGETGAVFVPAYSTDKYIVYNDDDSENAKLLTMEEVMGSELRKSELRISTVDSLLNVYQEARKDQSSVAQLKVRVPYRFAATALLDFDRAILRDCLCLFSRDEWW